MLTVTIQEPASGIVTDTVAGTEVAIRLPYCPACRHAGNGTCTHCGPICIACLFRGGVLVTIAPGGSNDQPETEVMPPIQEQA